jgi:hypothetical protein
VSLLRLHNRVAVIVACLCLIACNQEPDGASQAKSVSEPGRQASQVLFALEVSEYEGNVSRRLEPIVLIKDGTFTKPPSEEEEVQKFGETYLKPGLNYSLLWGGKEIGMVKVKTWIKEGCSGPVDEAEVEIAAPLELKGEVGALATNAPGLGQGKPSRRAPTESEKVRSLDVARDIYRSNGINKKLLQAIKVDHLVAADLDSDQTPEIIGNFRIEEEEKLDSGLNSLITHALFLVLRDNRNVLQPLVVRFRSGSGDSYSEEKFLDYIDLDKDGVAEVATKSFFYEGWGYRIYKFLKNEWKEVYHGGGGGC